MSNLVVKQFQGLDIRFETRSDGQVLGCLTDMAKVANKQIGHYLALESTKELNQALGGNAIKSKKGRNGGTWGVEDIVIDFGYWSNITFRLWVIKQIKDLMTTGVAVAQRPTESLEDFQKREQILKEENQRLLTENGYLQAWSPRMSLQKMRYLEIINYTPSDYSVFLKTTKELMDCGSMFYEHTIRESRMVHDLVDTLFEPGKTVSVCDYHFHNIDDFMEAMPVRFFDTAVRSPHEIGRKPKLRKGFEQFEGSVKVRHDNLYIVWLEFMPKKKEALMNYLNAPQASAV